MTVILTVAVAFFANGDNEQAAAAQAAPGPGSAQRGTVQPATPTFRDATDTATDDSGAWGSDDSDGFGRPTTEDASESQSLPPPLAGISAPAAVVDGDGSANGAAKDAAPPVPTAQDIAAAEAASRQRSGLAGRE